MPCRRDSRRTIAPGAGLFKAEGQQGAGVALDAAIAGSHRSAANKARDRYRHPKETLEFFGLRPEMTVVEIWPGGGWYTEILAPVLRERGKLYAACTASSPPFPYQAREMESFRAKLASAPGIYDGVTIRALAFPERARDRATGLRRSRRDVPQRAQLVPRRLRTAERRRARVQAIFTALKPGGVLGVVDHRWPDPATEDPGSRNGYVSEQRVIALAETAGFELAGRSDVNRNPLDTHDYPEGVWTLPPDLALGDATATSTSRSASRIASR